uniref:Uncharacterized protein n=1 Tax=Heterorhabditis bacteriophora TaxID=37862 RepID=A0A1I7WMC4_HETBA
MPSTSGVESPDRTLPMRMEAPETPSKCLAVSIEAFSCFCFICFRFLQLDDSGLFTDGFPILSTSTPLKRSHIEFASPVYHMEDQIVDSESSKQFIRMRIMIVICLDKNSNDGNLAFKFSTSEFVSTEASSHPDVPPRKRKRELEADEVFRSPKKPLKPVIIQMMVFSILADGYELLLVQPGFNEI